MLRIYSNRVPRHGNFLAFSNFSSHQKFIAARNEKKAKRDEIFDPTSLFEAHFLILKGKDRKAENLLAENARDIEKIKKMQKFEKNFPEKPRLHALNTTPKEQIQEQINLEEQATDEALKQYQNFNENMIKIGQAGTLPALQRQVKAWFSALKNRIEMEQNRIWTNRAGCGSKAYGPLLVLLRPDKLAVMVLHEALSQCLKCSNEGVPATSICKNLAEAVQSEVNLLKMKNKLGGKAVKMLDGSARVHVREINERAKQALDALEYEEWSEVQKVQLGAALVKALCISTKVIVESKESRSKPVYKKVFVHQIIRKESSAHLKGILSLSQEAFDEVKKLNSLCYSQIRFPPMLVPPRLWQRHDRGAYFRLKSKIMRTKGCESQIDALRTANLMKVFHCVNCLGALPWRINDQLCDVILEAWKRKLTIGNLPPQSNLSVPPRPKACKKFHKVKNCDSSAGKSYKFKFNKEYKEYDRLRKNHMRIVQLNRDRHSLRSDLRIKLDIIEKFREKDIYFPHNLDFRGRAYPMPPNLNHMGDDLSRGSLRFSEGMKLGHRGLFWLKVQVCSLWGLDKLSFDDRAKYTEENIDLVRDSVRNPLDPNCDWWTKADAPWQCLATCQELIAAIDSGDPENFLSTLPIHQDGSCNGLQHYAALGRDYFGGEQVNLLPGDDPRDVYSGVCDRVKKEVTQAAAYDKGDLDPSSGDKDAYNRKLCARLLDGLVDRKVVKQTVMTSVYGVTYIGARRQIQSRLEEKLQDIQAKGLIPENDDSDKIVKQCASFLASITLQSLKGLFSEAREIMDWLGLMAGIVSRQGQPMKWVTPLGLPVVQPYRRESMKVVSTVLQSMQLNLEDEMVPVSSRRQRSAFPPNFIHSLDSTHMMMTAFEMDRRGLPFAAVHDSYWCHAGNVDEMNTILRDCFIELYSNTILEDLHCSLQMQYPDAYFPPVPPRGTLDLNRVRDSKYFFN